jgi:Cys-tRNA(Pro)/Cys-tRNA(Cys) deacylase
MTPAIETAQRAGIAFTLHDYAHDPANTAYGLEAAEKLGVPAGRVFKTLVVEAGNALAVAIIAVDSSLSLKKIARASGNKRAAMADGRRVERTTGYVLGGVSPLGQKKSLPTFVDRRAAEYATVFVSAGKRGLEIELAPGDLLALTRGELADLRAGDDRVEDDG